MYTDHVIEARRPDIVVVKKETSECLLIDIAVSGDVRVERKEDEKVEKYRDLCRELGRLWKGLMLCGAGSCWSVRDCSQETPSLSGITGHQPVFGATTEISNFRDSSNIEESPRDQQRVWCAQALRQSSPQTGNLPSAV